MIRDVGRPARWRVLIDGPAEGAWNMAVDEALALEAEEDVRVLRFYEWAAPTISLGRNQPARGHYDLDRAQASGFSFVRRPTGGRAVLHDAELTYAVVVGDRALGGPRRTYERVQRVLSDGLVSWGASGVRQEPHGPDRAPPPSVEPCFGVALAGEVTLDGQKLIGSAQARIEGQVLQHGAILLTNDQRALDDLALQPPASPSPSSRATAAHTPRQGRATTLAATGASVQPRPLAEHLTGVFEQQFEGRFEPSELTPSEQQRARELHARYESAEWTWRR